LRSRNEIFLELKIRKEMEKIKPMSGMVMSTLPDADDFDLLSGACKSIKDGSRRYAIPPING
jgi:hypothetical protein